MTDHWEFFPCKMGENQAFIFYDHGIRDSIDAFPASQRVRIELTHKAPTPNGLPTDEEFEVASQIEDEITKFVTENSGAYVGRVTVDGRRFFYCYLMSAEEEVESFLVSLRERFEYQLVAAIKDDPEKSGYWRDLYPTEDDWQMIQDSKVVESLKNHGDPIEQSRRIDHWIFFCSRDDADRFAAQAHREGFELHGIQAPDKQADQYSVQVHRIDLPELYEINRVTFRLRTLAKESNGTYDGWETSVERGDV